MKTFLNRAYYFYKQASYLNAIGKGAIAGSLYGGLTGVVAGLAKSKEGHRVETAAKGGLAGAGIGALLGGTTGVILHDPIVKTERAVSGFNHFSDNLTNPPNFIGVDPNLYLKNTTKSVLDHGRGWKLI